MPELVAKPVSQLLGKDLEAEDFEKLIIEDSVKDLLVWVNRRSETKDLWTAAKWKIFRSQRLGHKSAGLVPACGMIHPHGPRKTKRVKRPDSPGWAAAGTGMGNQPGKPRSRTKPLPHRGDSRTRQRGKDFKSSHPPAFRESVRYAEQNLYTRARTLVGDRDPRGHEFAIQLRAMDNDKSGAGISLPAMIALCSGLLERSLRGGLIIVGAINLGGSIDMINNAVTTIELAVEKGAETVLMPVSVRKQLFDLSDDMAT